MSINQTLGDRYNSKYLILASDTLSAPKIESNCACPDISVSLNRSTQPVLTDIRYRMTQSMYSAALDQEHTVLFDPSHPYRTVVVNEAALQLARKFSTPCYLKDVMVSSDDPTFLALTQLIESEVLRTADVRILPELVETDMLTVWLHVTNECNLRCHYCFIEKTQDVMQEHIGLQAIDSVFRSAYRHGFRRIKLKYAGGEPTRNFALIQTIHKYAEELAIIHDVNLEGVILSNGIGITERMIDSIQEMNIRLVISLDGIGIANDVNRPLVNGNGSFHLVERTLNRLQARDYTPATISITVSNHNMDDLPSLVAYVLKRNLPFTLNYYRENDCSSGFGTLSYNEDAMIQAMRLAFGVIRENIPSYSLVNMLIDLARMDAPHSNTCGVGDSYMVIDHNGNVAKCHMDISNSLGDIFVQDPLLLILEDKSGIQNPPVTEKEGCRDCDWRYLCTGGCPLLTFRVTGRYDIKSPNCRIYQNLFPEVVKLEGLRLLKYGMQ